jgi:hypothetical protein
MKLLSGLIFLALLFVAVQAKSIAYFRSSKLMVGTFSSAIRKKKEKERKKKKRLTV